MCIGMAELQQDIFMELSELDITSHRCCKSMASTFRVRNPVSWPTCMPHSNRYLIDISNDRASRKGRKLRLRIHRIDIAMLQQNVSMAELEFLLLQGNVLLIHPMSIQCFAFSYKYDQ